MWLLVCTTVDCPKVCPVWAQDHCRISPACFLAECHKRQLNQTSFVLLGLHCLPFFLGYA